MVFLAIAAVALYVLPHMRLHETGVYLTEWWQILASRGADPQCITLNFGQDTLYQSPCLPYAPCVPISLASVTQARKAYGELLAAISCLV